MALKQEDGGERGEGDGQGVFIWGGGGELKGSNRF